MKSLEITLHYQDRYGQISWVLRREENMEDQDAIIWYEKFWNIQFEQFQYWQRGYLENSFYRYWLYCRYFEWLENGREGKIRYREGWNKTKEKYLFKTERFLNFVDEIHDAAAQGRQSEILKVMKRWRRKKEICADHKPKILRPWLHRIERKDCLENLSSNRIHRKHLLVIQFDSLLIYCYSFVKQGTRNNGYKVF